MKSIWDYIKSFWVKPKYNFVINYAENYVDTSYKGRVQSYMYSAYCKNTGTHLCKYVYGDIYNHDLLLNALNKGNFLGEDLG